MGDFADAKYRFLQLVRIMLPVGSGVDYIPVKGKLRYEAAYNLTDDLDLVYKSYIISAGFGQKELTEADTAWVDISGTGVINISDYQTDFGDLLNKKFVTADIYIKQNGAWYDYSSTVPILTKNVSRQIDSITWNLMADTSVYPITAIDIRLR